MALICDIRLFLSIGIVVGSIMLLFEKLWRRKTKTYGSNKLPPFYKGWLPWIGCVLEFGKAPVHFIDKKRKEMGPVFTLLVTGERMTFLLDPGEFHHFFQSSNLDFQKAVQSSVQRVASVTESSFFTYHTKIHDTVKGKLAAAQLNSLFAQLQRDFAEGLDQVQAGEHELLGLVRSMMYQPILENLFGKGILPIADKAKFKELEKHFVIFDEQFEYGAKLPPFFLKKWSKSKAWLLELFGQVTSGVDGEGEEEEKRTLFQALLDVVDAQHAANYSLLLMWASLANAVPIMFWTLAFILNSERIKLKAKHEVMAVLGTTNYVREESLAAIPYLKCCILEAIRLRSPGIITRRVVKPFIVKDMTVPAGDLLMVSPFWAHRNPELFAEPDSFIPERWQATDVEKNLFPDGFIAFGGGRYQCPGRWFALMELHLFLALFLQRFDCKLLGTIPDYSPLHLVGTQQPVTHCPCHLSRL